MQDERKTKRQLIDELVEMRRRVSDAEEALQRCTAELKQGQEEFKTFAYIVSHDLRTPLINLRGFSAELRSAAEVLRSAFDEVSPHWDEGQRAAVVAALQEDIPEALGFIEFSVTRIDNFINAVLRLSRLSRRELKFELVDVDGLVQATLEPLADEIEQRQAKVVVDSPLPEVIADHDSLEEVLGIILRNAVVYLDPNRSGEVEVTGERGPDETAFHIRDNGRGVVKEDMSKVFEPFRRAGRQDVSGEGMGLVYAQTLIRRHRGRIWCTSEPGVGTTFVFTISNHLVKGDSYAQ
jgi:signal transduction histidine kinase